MLNSADVLQMRCQDQSGRAPMLRASPCALRCVPRARCAPQGAGTWQSQASLQGSSAATGRMRWSAAPRPGSATASRPASSPRQQVGSGSQMDKALRLQSTLMHATLSCVALVASSTVLGQRALLVQLTTHQAQDAVHCQQSCRQRRPKHLWECSWDTQGTLQVSQRTQEEGSD